LQGTGGCRKLRFAIRAGFCFVESQGVFKSFLL
jgi:hypothetical protein